MKRISAISEYVTQYLGIAESAELISPYVDEYL